MKYKLTTATAGNWHKLDPDLAPEPVLVSSNTVSITAYNTSLDLTEDVSSVDWSLFMDLSPGDSGSICITQDGNGPWTFFGGSPDDKYLAGDVADIATMVAGDVCIVGWLYHSESTSVPGSPSMLYFTSEGSS